VVYLRNFAPNEKLTFDMLKYNLLNDETRGKGKVVPPSQNEVLVMESRG